MSNSSIRVVEEMKASQCNHFKCSHSFFWQNQDISLQLAPIILNFFSKLIKVLSIWGGGGGINIMKNNLFALLSSSG